MLLDCLGNLFSSGRCLATFLFFTMPFNQEIELLFNNIGRERRVFNACGGVLRVSEKDEMSMHAIVV